MDKVLQALWDSTDALHQRFDLFPPDHDKTLMVFHEEALEFQEAADMLAWSGKGNVADVCMEAADVLVTVLATLSSLGITREQFAEYALKVAAKNDAKSHETHYVAANGKITRRNKS